MKNIRLLPLVLLFLQISAHAQDPAQEQNKSTDEKYQPIIAHFEISPTGDFSNKWKIEPILTNRLTVQLKAADSHPVGEGKWLISDLEEISFHLVLRDEEGKVKYQKWVRNLEIVDLSEIIFLKKQTIEIDNVRYSISTKLLNSDELSKEQQATLNSTPRIQGTITIEYTNDFPAEFSKTSSSETELLQRLASEAQQAGYFYMTRQNETERSKPVDIDRLKKANSRARQMHQLKYLSNIWLEDLIDAKK